MPRPKKKRVPTCPITFSEYDQKWHGYLNVGKKGNGKPDIRHRSANTADECAEKIIELEDEIAASGGAAPKKGLSPLLVDYLWQWHAAGSKPVKTRKGFKARWKYKTIRDYELVIRDYIAPFAKGHRLDDFTRTTKHAKFVLAEVSEKVSAHAARKAHRVMRSALSTAEADDLVSRNVLKAIAEPEVEEAEEEFLTAQEGFALLKAIARRPRNRSRWLTGVGLGQRQGECLGLRWHRPELRGEAGDVDLQEGTITVRTKLLRKTWLHGCADPVLCVKSRVDGRGKSYDICKANACGQKFEHSCGAEPCRRQQARYCPQRHQPSGCWRHRDKHGKQKDCPPPCPNDCAGHASTCPQRTGGGLVDEDPKSKAGKRTTKMPGPIWQAYRDTKAQQDTERERAGSAWVETGYIHTTELGLPIDARRDWEEWYEICAEAGIDPIRLHAARHLAATILLLLKVPIRVIMHILGWSTDQSKRYGHILREMLDEVADQLEAFLWPELAAEPDPEPTPFRKPKSRPQSSSTDLSTSNVIQFRPRAV